MSTPPKTLLVVDDDEGMRDTLAAILKRDYHVLVESSAESAQAVLSRSRIDLMLLDVRLPGMSGLDLLKIIKDTQPLIEVIVISAVSEVETAVAAGSCIDWVSVPAANGVRNQPGGCRDGYITYSPVSYTHLGFVSLEDLVRRFRKRLRMEKYILYLESSIYWREATGGGELRSLSGLITEMGDRCV